MTIRGLGIGVAFVGIALATPAQGQPARRPAPAAPAPAPAPIVTPSSKSAKPPVLQLEPCGGTMVYITSKTWRECCLLCVSDDSPSDAERTELEEAFDRDTVIHQYFTVGGTGRGDRPVGQAGRADDDDGEARRPRSKSADRKGPARTSYGGYAGLTSLAPTFGGPE